MTRQPDLLDDSEEVTRKFNHKKHEAALEELIKQRRLGVRFRGDKLQVIKLLDTSVVAGELRTKVIACDRRGEVYEAWAFSESAKRAFDLTASWFSGIDATFALIHDPSQYPKAASR